MHHYTNIEFADMHKAFGAAYGNANLAQRIYEEQHPQRHIPCHTTFSRLDQRLRDSGQCQARKIDSGRHRTVRTLNFEDEVLQRFENNPRTSTRAVSHTMGTSHMSVWRVLSEYEKHPFHIQKVQTLMPDDYHDRLQFAEWYLHTANNDPDFSRRILWTDEACFSRDGFFNTHNSHIWSDTNPKAVENVRNQWKFSVNIWVGFVDGYLVGPYVFPARLDGHFYGIFLEEMLPELLEDVPINIRRNLIFQHDGAPAHFDLNCRNYLNVHFPNRWIGRAGPIAWPARSPDMTPADFCVWGHIKTIVYETPVDTVEELVARIILAFDDLRDRPQIFRRIRRSIIRRYMLCVNNGGRNFEQFL